MATSKKMGIDEIRYQLDFFKSKRDNAVTDDDRRMYSNMMKNWEDKLANTVQADIDRRTERLRAKVEALGVAFKVWEDWAHSLYEITKHGSGYTVKSHARNWLQDVVWEVDSDIGAQEKIYQLIIYKKQDRGRGRGDMLKDLGLIQ